MRAVIGTAVFVIVVAVGLALVSGFGGAVWAVALVVLVALAAGVLAAAQTGAPRSRPGVGTCPECRGEGRAFYGRGRTTYRRRCRTCRGRGQAHVSATIPEALLHPGTRTEGESVPL
ncbi:hypothetical protein CC117_18600 [Parafrankia colletiae]|uniref:Uncharacterized protein n=1 Tax=Parafrankia colletiae TaxID=573497 RepID=A0A1S1QS26_9ACTN|nr:hypothetical protein [Parafrankia colletiae]MCK9901005.1 hypothetical protein [Frankia sp. Cpl3]OHV36231.1 hypothetical protein CC117_18600 [Parafrankia colletiae]